MNNVLKLVQGFVELLTFRCGPRDMPYSRDLTIVVSVALLFLLSANDALYESTVHNFLFSVLRVYSLALLLYFFLYCLHLQGRWLQTLIALYGISVVLESLRLIIMLITPAHWTPFPILIVHQAIGIWHLVVSVSIIKQAMQLTTGKAILVGLGCGMLPAMLGIMLFGLPAQFAPQPS